MNSSIPTAVDDQVNIPVIDIDEDDCPRKLLEAVSKYGFIFIKHTEALSLTPADVDAMFETSRNFFTSTKKVKEEFSYKNDKTGKNLGFLPMKSETLDPDSQKNGDFKEAYNIGAFDNGRPQQPLPTPLKASKDRIGNFIEKCHSMCEKILRQLAAALKIPDEEGGVEWFATRHDRSKGGPGGNTLRLNYYPAVDDKDLPDPTHDLRAGAHSDYGSLTLLFRLPDQPGLEIKTASGVWATVPADPDPNRSSQSLPILVNIGDLMAFWTNGLLKSTVHRVVFPKVGDSPSKSMDRYSIAYFCHPLSSTQLVEVPSYIVQMEGDKRPNDVKPKDKVMTALDHLNGRLMATFEVRAR